MGERKKRTPEKKQGLETIEQWANSIILKLLREYDPRRPILLLSDIDDTIFNTSLGWYKYFAHIANNLAVPINEIPTFEYFKANGSRATFEILIGGTTAYNTHRDQLLSNEMAHSDLQLLINPQELQDLIKNVGTFGGYITGRPPSLKDTTLFEISSSVLPLAPVLHQPPTFDYHSGIDYKITALSILVKKIRERGLKQVQIIYIDDYPEMVEKINIQLEGAVTALQFSGSLEHIEQKILQPAYDFRHLVAVIPFDRQATTNRDSRNWIYEMAITNLRGHGEFLNDIFFHALFPPKSRDLVKELNDKFSLDWLDLQEQWGQPDYSASALAALYFFCRDFLAPLKYIFTLQTLQEFSGTGACVHFMARDAFSEFVIATNMEQSKKLPEMPEFNYVPLSVRLMREMDDPEKRSSLIKYLRQFGFGNGGKHVIVDVGFTGEIPHRLNQLFPQDTYIVRLLLSEANDKIKEERPVMQQATGFIYDKGNPDAFGIASIQLNSIYKRMLENSFSGLFTSSTELVKTTTEIRTNSRKYDPNTYNAVRRIIAQRAIKDAIMIWDVALSDNRFGPRGLLNKRLIVSLISNFKQLTLFHSRLLDSDQIFVEHEPTNFNPSFI